ncbi:methyltransferase family protein [Cylindrospermum stagnale PCC 7417]|uniref:Methyltransferase family protein n=1 Tax=Cylindrospermum stagnale PCC 7417 TaxID=56107 RepID=K9WTZ0_9NOST|nr:class I SAM-dependent methyltransferase [Cylindrospermum stagnale]AFZ23241.1 methyltransferase family protein [Cylindrospermum stagnale PCC 7417]
MLAPKNIPSEYTAWNQKQKAPVGANWWYEYVNSQKPGNNFIWRNRYKWPSFIIKKIGPFGFQVNSLSRIFEYPWCFLATPLQPGMRVVEVGAGASGFQFALAQAGLDVTSVDPLINPSESVDWIFSKDDFYHLNQSFGGKVKFIQDFLQNAKLESNQYDRVFSVSAIEHIPSQEIGSLVKEIGRILKPGGLFLATIDLFLDCYPFTNQVSNQYGSNISISSLVEESGLKLKIGNPSELYGYPEFDYNLILNRLDEFLVVNKVLTQCIVLEKAI